MKVRAASADMAHVRSPALSGALVAFAAFVGVFATTPGQTVGVSSFIDPIAADVGVSRDNVLVLYSIGTFLGILTAPAFGRLVDRVGPRALIAPVVVGLGCACGFASVVWNAWSLGLEFVLLRATAIAGLSLISTQMVNLWFDRLRGRILALTMLGTALTLLVNAVNTALVLDHVRAMAAAGIGRSQAIGVLGAMTTTQALATLASGVLVDRFGARPVGLLGLATLAASVLSVMWAPAVGGGLLYAVLLGAMIGLLQVSHSSGLAECFGIAHLGSIKGTTFVVGVSGAALGPLALLWSPTAAYSIYLGLTVVGALLGVASLRYGRRAVPVT